ncbi:hypothetical protein B7H17_16780 [Pseudomonas putida]|uniref:Suppressor of fused-like domain-containing protein n=3 Tax=Pseudomonas TaxID=286 RepID=A0A1X0ZTF1_PSEPU|nr:hypothetical protein B7H17_16780 [Pseudomonas putida]
MNSARGWSLCRSIDSRNLLGECGSVGCVSYQKQQAAVMPGDVVREIFSEYLVRPKMPHIYLTIPFMWNDSYFPELQYSNFKVNWLQCIAIHEEERVFIERYGGDVFDNLLFEQEINTLDCNRPRIVFPDKLFLRAHELYRCCRAVDRIWIG